MLRILSVQFDYKIENGKLFVDTFPVKIAGMNSNISGSSSITGEVDYKFNLDVPSDKVGVKSSSFLAKGLNLASGGNIPVNLSIGGTFLKPKIFAYFCRL